jgi:hypothetical protein
MLPLGKTLITLGALLAIVGAVLILGDKLGIHFGRLPGDLTWRGKRGSVHFPIVTSIVVSLVLTVIVNLWLRRK